MSRSPEGPAAAEGLLERLRVWVERAARFRLSAPMRRVLLLVSVLLFVGAATWGILGLPPLELRVSWMAVAAGVALVTPITNAFEYWLAGRWVDARISVGEALSVTIQASAANLAPIPGAVLVRGRALYSRGASPVAAARALGAIGVGWLAVSFSAAAATFASRGEGVLTGAFGAGGLACGGLLAALLSTDDRPLRAVVVCLGVESLAVAAAGGRLFLVLGGLGIRAGVEQVFVLPVAGAIASAAGIFPGGLGLRELLAGGLAPLVGLPAEAGVVGTAVDRVLGVVLLAVVGGVLVAVESTDASSRGEREAPVTGPPEKVDGRGADGTTGPEADER